MSVHNEYTGSTLKHLLLRHMCNLAATDANVLRAQALHSETSYWRMFSGQVLTRECSLHTVLCGDLYTACVDASRTVFWDRSKGK